MTVPTKFMTATLQDELPDSIAMTMTNNTYPLVNRNSRVRVYQNKSGWARELQDRLNKLTSLPKRWDGYAGQPVSFTVAQFAANLIERLCIDGVPVPQLVPGSDGTMQLEWHLNGYDIEIDVLAPFEVVATRYDHLSDAEDEIEVQSDFSGLANWVIALGKERAAAQVAEN